MEKRLISEPISNRVMVGVPGDTVKQESPYLCENSLSVVDRVAKLEDVVNKIDKPSTSNGEDIDMSPERIKALEAELAETKRVCFHILCFLVYSTLESNFENVYLVGREEQ
jgi:peptidoglycan hydrolase CwlO-like protein